MGSVPAAAAAALVAAAAALGGARAASAGSDAPAAPAAGWVFEDGGALSPAMAASEGGHRLVLVGPDRGVLINPEGGAAAVRRVGAEAAEVVAPTAALRAAAAAARRARESQRAPCPWDATDAACAAWCAAVAPAAVERPTGRADGPPCGRPGASAGGAGGPTCRCGDARAVWAECASNCSAPAAPREAPPQAPTGEAKPKVKAKSKAKAKAPQAQPPPAPAEGAPAGGASTAAAGGARRYLLYDARFGTSFAAQLEVLFTAMRVVKELNAQAEALCADSARGAAAEARCAPWTLVLPTWCAVVHWYSEAELPWRELFDVSSLAGAAVPVVEFEAFAHDAGASGTARVDLSVVATAPRGGDASSGDGARGEFLGWSPSPEECEGLLTQPRSVKGGVLLDYSGYCDVKVLAGDLKCGRLRKPTWRALGDLVAAAAATGARRVLLKSLDAAGAHSPGGAAARLFHPALRPAAALRAEADRFVAATLGVLDYLAVHMRRNEHRRHHPEAVPSAAAAALRLNSLLRELGLEQVFVATDAPEGFREDLRRRVKAPLYYFAQDDGARVPEHSGQAELIVLRVLARGAHFVGTEHSALTAAVIRERLHAGRTEGSSTEVFCPQLPEERQKHDHESRCVSRYHARRAAQQVR